MKSTWSLLLASGVIVLVLVFVSSQGKKKTPSIPIDTAHRNILVQEGCVTCHAPGRQAPLKDTHPPKEQCFICHKISER